MDIKEKLKKFKGRVDPEIEKYLDQVIEESEKRSDLVTQSLRHVKSMVLAGGKRVRPALMYYGYIGMGGAERKKALSTSVSIELIHAFLLIHDDIIDKDNIRHGEDSIHWRYQKLGKRAFKGKDYEHFGNSMAIIIGDMIGALGNQIIFNSKFDSDIIMKALDKLQAIVSMTVVGQAQDLYMEYSDKATEEDILKMYENKTAKYTVEGPLHLGAILGGADDEVLEKISNLSIPLGIAFQIQDDILGVYGTEKKLGKPLGSDIQEGKQTLLIIKTLEKANKKDKEFLLSRLGNKKIYKADIVKIQKIIKESGALDYSQNLAKNLIEKGKQEVKKLGFKKESENFLLGIADYMANREF